MVKINNPLGDVKIGKQGEVVYQRKYGQQIRRQLSPKRAIASQAQIAHRQLYRDALAWRKQLSLPNRRYLEGYCIANGIVDDYYIPLPWSRFALKLYLQAVKFKLSNISITEGEEVNTKYQHYETGGTSHFQIDDVFMVGQSFTPEVPHTLTRVIVRLYRLGNPPPLRVGLYLADGTHVATGGELSGVALDGSGVTLLIVGEWVIIDLPSYPLLAETEYVITINGKDGNATNRLHWKVDTSAPTYARGISSYYTWATETWTPYPAGDCMFQEWSIISVPGVKTGLLHVMHPALLTVSQMRGELLIAGYDTLSSLDEEYLTKQVGLDVEVNDIITATSLPGMMSTYPIL